MLESKHNKIFSFSENIAIKITLEINVFNLKLVLTQLSNISYFIVLTQLSNISHFKFILKNNIVRNNFIKFDKININFTKLLKFLFVNNCK